MRTEQAHEDGIFFPDDLGDPLFHQTRDGGAFPAGRDRHREIAARHDGRHDEAAIPGVVHGIHGNTVAAGRRRHGGVHGTVVGGGNDQRLMSDVACAKAPLPDHHPPARERAARRHGVQADNGHEGTAVEQRTRLANRNRAGSHDEAGAAGQVHEQRVESHRRIVPRFAPRTNAAILASGWYPGRRAMDRCFAYGSNLNLRDLEIWCQRMGRPPALMVRPGVPAYLPDHELVFDYLSSSRKGGVLDLRPSIGRIVPGALFEVTEEDLRTLDLKEGVPLIYRQVEKRVLLTDGREVLARAYEVAPEYRLPAPVAPAASYVEIVAAGLAAFGHGDAMLRAAAAGEQTPFLVTGLFVYGTLLRGGSRHGEFDRCGGESDTVPATAKGVLLDCGSFPGMLAGTGGTVHGELVGLRDVPLALTHLDGVEGFEGFEASRALFRRALIKVTTVDAVEQLAWTYLWAGTDRHPRIVGGDWLAARDGR